MTRKELEASKERFEKEGYIHNNVIKELFEIAEKVVKEDYRHVEIEPGC